MAERKTMKRRKALARIALLMVIVFGVGLIALHQISKTPRYQIRYDYTVGYGDTLWGIAAKHAPEGMDIREYIYELQKINGDDVAQLKAGQVITLYR